MSFRASSGPDGGRLSGNTHEPLPEPEHPRTADRSQPLSPIPDFEGETYECYTTNCHHRDSWFLLSPARTKMEFEQMDNGSSRSWNGDCSMGRRRLHDAVAYSPKRTRPLALCTDPVYIPHSPGFGNGCYLGFQ